MEDSSEFENLRVERLTRRWSRLEARKVFRSSRAGGLFGVHWCEGFWSAGRCTGARGLMDSSESKGPREPGCSMVFRSWRTGEFSRDRRPGVFGVRDGVSDLEDWGTLRSQTVQRIRNARWHDADKRLETSWSSKVQKLWALDGWRVTARSSDGASELDGWRILRSPTA